MKAWILALVLLPATLVGGVALALACKNDVDCPCGDVCSWANQATPNCVAADGGSPGWCGSNNNTNCLYQGQTCSTSMNMCMPVWTPSSVCLQGTATGGGTGSGSSGGGGSGSSSGNGSGSGGCSSAPGELGWGTVLVALGLLRRSRRRTA